MWNEKVRITEQAGLKNMDLIYKQMYQRIDENFDSKQFMVPEKVKLYQ